MQTALDQLRAGLARWVLEANYLYSTAGMAGICLGLAATLLASPARRLFR